MITTKINIKHTFEENLADSPGKVVPSINPFWLLRLIWQKTFLKMQYVGGNLETFK